MNYAVKNKMTVNLLKTVEIFFHRPSIGQDLLPLKMTNVSRVNVVGHRKTFNASQVAKLLGVYLRHDLNSSQYVDAILLPLYSKLSFSIKFCMPYQFIMDI